MIDPTTTNEELLAALQARFPQGLTALCLPDSDEKLYLWWGDRTLALGQTTRLSHAINMELEGCESEVLEMIEDPEPELPYLQDHFGQYL